MPFSPEVVHKDQTFAVVIGGRVVAAVWKDAPTLAQMGRLRAATDRHKKMSPDGGALVNIVVSGTPSFRNEVRVEAAKQTSENDTWGIATAHVVLVDGFAGIAVRSFFSTMTLLGRSKVPTKVFGDLDEATRWVASHLRLRDASCTAAVVKATCDAAMRA